MYSVSITAVGGDTSVTAAESDFGQGLGRALFYCGLFASSLTAFRAAGLTLGDILLGLSLIPALVSRAVRPRKEAPIGNVTVAVALLLVVGGAISTSTAIIPIESLAVLARLLFLALVLPWQATYLLATAPDLRRAVTWFAAGGAVCGFGTLIQAQFGAGVIPGAELTTAGRYTGFAQHVSDTGGITSISIVLSIGLLLTATRALQRILAILFLVGGGIGLILSGSVSGMIAVLVGLTVLVVGGAMKIRYLALTAVVASLVFYVAAAIQSATTGALNPLQRFLQTIGVTADGQYSTTEIRSETYQVALAAVGRHPFVGAGLDNTSSIVDGVFPAHNLLLAATYQGGVLLLAGIVIAIARPFAGRWIPRARTATTVFLLGGAASAFVFAMTAPSMYNRYFWLPIVFVMVAKSLTIRGELALGPSPGPWDAANRVVR